MLFDKQKFITFERAFLELHNKIKINWITLSIYKLQRDKHVCKWTFLSMLEINSTEIIFEIVLEQFWLFYDKVPSFLVTGAKFQFLEIISNTTVIFLKKRYAAITPSVTHTLIRNLCRWTFLSLLEINSTEIIFEIVLEQFWLFYDKVPSFLVTGEKFHFLEIISNATVIFF